MGTRFLLSQCRLLSKKRAILNTTKEKKNCTVFDYILPILTGIPGFSCAVDSMPCFFCSPQSLGTERILVLAYFPAREMQTPTNVIR